MADRKIFFDRRGELKVDATVYDKNRNVVAVIKASDFAVLNASWDRNLDRTAFEIVDEDRIPFFQIERRRPNLIKFERPLELLLAQSWLVVIRDSS